MSEKNTNLKEEIRTIIAEQLNKKPHDIKDEDNFEKLGADSLDRVEIVMKLEERFGVEIDDAAAEKLSSVGEVMSYVSSLKH